MIGSVSYGFFKNNILTVLKAYAEYSKQKFPPHYINFFSFFPQANDGYESIYNNSVSYGYGGSLLNSPTKSINSVPSVSPQPHHYISSYRARSSLSRKTGSKAAAAFAAASAAASNGSTSSSVTLDRGHSDLSFRLAASLRQRYQQLCDDLPATSWCPEFRPHVRQM